MLCGMKERLAPTKQARDGLVLLLGMVALMWFLEAINSVTTHHDALAVDGGILPRNIGHLWAIFTAPFLHQSFYPHLFDNTIPLLFMGVVIALRGARRLALVTLIVIVVSGLGTWLISPGNSDTFGASGIVFGYATYLLARGIFNRSVLEIAVGLIVGVVWGAALISSIVPHAGVSWQAHVCGALGGVVAAYLLSGQRGRQREDSGSDGASSPPERRPIGGHDLHIALDRALSS
jgi:membrane associated rhomboid family serine protease